MKKHNLYKDAVLILMAVMLVFGLVRGTKQWQQERNVYSFAVTKQTSWTNKDIEEMKKLSGLLKFAPVDTLNVTIRLEGYELETNIKGVNLEDYPIKLKSENSTFEMGNTAILFMGESCFELFAGSNGKHPGSSEIRAWIENYNEIELIITDEKGETKKANLGGILSSSDNYVYMEQSQMNMVYKDTVQANEGYVEIFGYNNMKYAKEAFEGGGITCGEGRIK